MMIQMHYHSRYCHVESKKLLVVWEEVLSLLHHLLVEQFSLSNQTMKSGVTSAGTNHIAWTLQCVFEHHQGSQTLSGNAERDIAMVIVAVGVVSD